jgi:AcrR family transcriptional regulator
MDDERCHSEGGKRPKNLAHMKKDENMDTQLSPKVKALFEAIDSLMNDGHYVNSMTVSQIASRAGIGKGTTNEYFKNKEELIGGAIVYKISAICREIQIEMAAKADLREMIYYLLDAIDNKEYEKAALLKVVNIVTDHSPVSRQIERIIAGHIGDTYMPERILDDLLAQAEKEGFKNNGFPAEYIKLNVAAKLLAYTMFGMMPNEERDCDTESMHKLVCEGILKELELT